MQTNASIVQRGLLSGQESNQTSFAVPASYPEPPGYNSAFWKRVKRELETCELKSNSFPIKRVKKIIKSDQDVQLVGGELNLLFAKACEIFVWELTTRAWSETVKNRRKTISRDDIATALTQTDMYDFLIDIVPRDDIIRQKDLKRKAQNQTAGLITIEPISEEDRNRMRSQLMEEEMNRREELKRRNEESREEENIQRDERETRKRQLEEMQKEHMQNQQIEQLKMQRERNLGHFSFNNNNNIDRRVQLQRLELEMSTNRNLNPSHNSINVPPSSQRSSLIAEEVLDLLNRE
eukprot:TRINITY_DN5526_c0_g1_i1.p1 TRINITY_DN5526_c0_g1~~TRINITY_DN5526_c0_g1_i1.p1  ORF type:complete len:293 (-),score=95.07 TRINITY_DN5526_c0_g1_i1:37-915(-)